MKPFLLTLLLATLCATGYGQIVRKTVMVDTNGVLQSPTNFWQANAVTNFQQFLGVPKSATNGATNSFLKLSHNVAEVSATNLGIEYPHALLALSNKLYIGRRGTTGSGNAEILIFNDPINNFTNKTRITITNSGGVPEMAYSENTGLIYVATVSDGVYTLNPSNNATTLAVADPMSFLGTIAVSSDHLWWADGRVLKKYALSNNLLVQSYTNTNVTVTAGGVFAGFHSAAVTPDGTKLVLGGTSSGSTTNNPATISVFNIASNAFTATTIIPNQYLLTDDMAVNNDEAFLGFEQSGAIALAYNLQINTFAELGGANDGRAYFVTRKNNDVYFGAINNTVLKYNTQTEKTVVFANEVTNSASYNEMAFIDDSAFVTTFDSLTNAVLAEIKFVSSVVNDSLKSVDGAGIFQEIFTVYTNVLTSNITAPAGRAVWLDYVADETNRTVDATGRFTGTYTNIGDVFVVRNRGTNNNIEIRRTGTLVQEGSIAPNEQRAWVFTGTGTGEARWKLMQGRLPLGLGATWLTNTNVTNFRTAIGLGLPALTNTSNVTMMRELAGSTNTNEPFSGSISVVGTNNTNTLVFSNGILLSQ
jgi:hypothetical protein